MIIDGEVTDGVAVPGGGPVSRRRPSWLLPAAGVLAAGLVVAGVVLVRPAAPPEPVAAPQPSAPSDDRVTGPVDITVDQLGPDGIGNIRIGMTEAEFADLYPDGVLALPTDDGTGCIRESDNTPFNGAAGFWVWIRSGVVATVGVAWWSNPVKTSFGPAFGFPMTRQDPALAEWTWDDSAGLPVARRTTADRVLTLADVNGLDTQDTVGYATVGTPDGDACTAPAQWFARSTDPSPPAGSILTG